MFFFKNVWYFSDSKYSILITFNKIHFSHFSHFRIYWKHFSIILSFLSLLLDEHKLVSSNSLLPFTIKSKNPLQRYSFCIEMYACILKIFVWIFLLPMNLISFGICSTPKLSRYVTLSLCTYKAIQWAPTDLYSSRFIIYAPSFILGTLFLEQMSFILIILLYFKIS